MKKRIIIAIITKYYNIKKRINLSSEKKRNYTNKNKDNTHLDKANNKYLLQL